MILDLVLKIEETLYENQRYIQTGITREAKLNKTLIQIKNYYLSSLYIVCKTYIFAHAMKQRVLSGW